jgi:cobalamin-dependent methionine synthase I
VRAFVFYGARGACAAVFLGMAGVTSATDQEHIRQIAMNLHLAPPERIGVDLSDEWQLHPEQSTSAIVLHHPRAKYFSV